MFIFQTVHKSLNLVGDASERFKGSMRVPLYLHMVTQRVDGGLGGCKRLFY